MGCDLCGKDVQLFETIVEGTKLTVCSGCSNFGNIVKKVGASEEEEYRRKIVSVSDGERKIIEGVVENYSTLVKKAREQKGMKQKEVAKKIVREGELVKLDLKATDEDGDELTYTFTEPLSEKGEWQTKEGDKGEYTTEITVSDGKSEITKKLLIVVKEVNNEPVVESFSPNNKFDQKALIANIDELNVIKNKAPAP